nr:hypothetical protein [Candidatus Sigynarchaeota archaeon]
MLDTNALIHWEKELRQEPTREPICITTIFSMVEYPEALKYPEITLLYPSIATYDKSIKYAAKLRKVGTMIPAIDVLIGTLAVERKVKLVTDDGHFASFHSIEPGLEIVEFNQFKSEIDVKTKNGGKKKGSKD